MEFKKVREAEANQAANQGQGAMEEACPPEAGADGAFAASPAKPGAMSASDVDDGMHIVMEGMGARTDPVHDRAKTMAEQDLVHIARHTKQDNLRDDIA